MYVPRLPDIEFYDRADFPWLDALEAAAGDIREELVQVLADGPAVLEPYVSVDGVPQDRWREPNKSRRGVGDFYGELPSEAQGAV